MAKLSVDKTIIKAKSHEKNGEILLAKKLYQAILETFPNNKRAQQALTALNISNQSALQNNHLKAIDQLIILYNQGQFSSVVEQAQILTEEYPKIFIIWNILGVSAAQIGMLDIAIEAFKKSVSLNPDYAETFCNMGNVLKEQGKMEEAIKAYKNALLLKPELAEAHSNMGVVFQHQGKLDESIVSYKKSILLNPDYAEAYSNMGNVLQSQGKLKEAIEVYNKCVSLNPNDVETYFKIGIALQHQGKLEEAIKAYNKSISLKPDHAQAYNNMGVALQHQDKFEKAIEAYNKSLLLNPDYAEAYSNIGNIYHDQGKLELAIEFYTKSILIKPDYAQAYKNMGKVLADQGKYKKSIEAYNKALSIKPDYESVRADRLHLQAHFCDWNSIEEDRKMISTLGTFDKSVIPFFMIYLEDAPERHYLRSKVYATNKYPQKPIPIKSKPLKKPERIRIGYFSADFKTHPVAFLIKKVIEQHNRDKFEIFAYSLTNNKEDELKKQLEKSFDAFKDVSKINDKEVALLSRKDNIDIAIDLNGFTINSRSSIFAYRAAPIQINYLGFPGTMGTNFIDYIIADRHIIPPSNKKFFTEKKIYLPNTYMPTDNSRVFYNRFISRSEMGLPDESFVFCCFNNNYKITNLEFEIWMRLLNKIKGSVLWLRRSNQLSDKNLIKEAQKRNIDATRLVFADHVPIDKHLSRYKLADLFIDTFSFNAHTTTTEALWAGLPVVTKQGQGFAARVAGSLLNAIGLPELVTENESDYEALILKLATNPNKLMAIREKIAANRLSQPLFDTELYVKHLENGYQQAYQNYFDGKVPETIIVPH